MEYNINQLRSWGMRYIVCDRNGGIWAMDALPERSIKHPGHWKIQDKLMGHHDYYNRISRYRSVPLNNCPFEIKWEDEPFDLVTNGIVPETDMKKWPDLPWERGDV